MHLAQFGSTLRGMGDTKPQPQYIPGGRRLAAVRNALEKKLHEIAADCGTTTKALNNYERGKRPIPVLLLARISRAYDCPGIAEFVANANRGLLPQRIAERVKSATIEVDAAAE